MAEQAEGVGGLRQIQVRFEPEQDRLRLRIKTSSSAVLQCWLTRRLVRRLWPHLENALAQNAQVSSQASEEARDAMKQFQREGALQKSDFTQPFDEEGDLPLGDAPLLVAKASLGRSEENPGLHVLRLEPKQGRGLNLSLPDPILHTICELIRRAVAKTDWDLDLAPAPENTESPAIRH